jgi:hypothetical protein
MSPPFEGKVAGPPWPGADFWSVLHFLRVLTGFGPFNFPFQFKSTVSAFCEDFFGDIGTCLGDEFGDRDLEIGGYGRVGGCRIL